MGGTQGKSFQVLPKNLNGAVQKTTLGKLALDHEYMGKLAVLFAQIT